MLRLTKDSAVVMGSSAGGLEALKLILSDLPKSFPCPIIIVQHFPSNTKFLLPKILGTRCELRVKEATDKEPLKPGTIYTAPPGYHLLVEELKTLALSVDERVNWSRPSIDVLFETAAEVYQEKLTGILLTGANEDGASGLRAISNHGGFIIVQDPDTAESKIMPLAGIRVAQVNLVLSLEEIASMLSKFNR